MYKSLFNQRKALRFRQFSRKGWALFACLGRVVTIGVLSVATLESATAAHRHVSTDEQPADSTQTTDKEATLDDVEVTGSRAPLATGQAVRIVTVLTREDIQAAPVQSINDLLKMAGGVDVRQRGPLGAQTDVSIRGGNSEQIAVLLNGINICDPQTGHNTFDLPCDLADIVRIEVLEGPAARAYGTSSLAGAVNIVTNAPSGLGTRLEGGSFGYLSAAVSAAMARHGVSASYTRSDGYQRARSGALNSDYAGGKAFYQGSYGDGDVRLNWHAGLSVKGYGSNTFYSAKYDEQYEHTTKLFAALQGKLSVPNSPLVVSPSVYWNRGYDRFELIRGVETTVPFNRHRTDVFGINLNSHFDWLLGRTAFGAEFRNEDIVSSTLGEPLHHPDGSYVSGLNRSNLSLHLEHNVVLSRLTLSAGFMAVKNTWNEMPFTLYPGIDAALRLGDRLKLYASYNSSLRMPSFTELYYSVGGHKADKYLQPEELQAVECGFTLLVPRTSHLAPRTSHLAPHTPIILRAAIFHHHARNLIDWVMDTRDADAVWQSVNHTRINTFGQEVGIDVRLPSLTVGVAYCHQHQSKAGADYLQSQYALDYLRHKLTAQVRLSLTEHLGLTLGYRFQDRNGTYTDTNGEVQSYHPYSLVDSRIDWRLRTCSFYVEANNLLNHRYVDYGNVPQPGLWLTFGLIYNKR